jgi:hypothetical protein
MGTQQTARIIDERLEKKVRENVTILTLWWFPLVLWGWNLADNVDWGQLEHTALTLLILSPSLDYYRLRKKNQSH